MGEREKKCLEEARKRIRKEKFARKKRPRENSGRLVLYKNKQEKLNFFRLIVGIYDSFTICSVHL